MKLKGLHVLRGLRSLQQNQ